MDAQLVNGDVAAAKDMVEEVQAEKAERRISMLGYSYRMTKRCIDICASLLGIILCAPLLVVTAIAIKMEDGGPVFFTQVRIGKGCKPFAIYKFRSMRKDADKIHEQLRQEYHNEEVSFKLKDDPRITKTGKWIRKYNIDELPQLINILKGNMSLVGPRPLPDYEYQEEQRKYSNKYSRRYQVPQGLTCIWQISNRANVGFEKRMQMDVDYAEKCSLRMDLKLIIKTFMYTLTGKAAY